MRPAEPMTVSQWADRHRILPNDAAEPGRWRTARTPYLREIMDALSEDCPIETVVIMAGSQVGKTEAGLNWLGYLIDHAPGLALLVMPSLDMTRRNVRTRIDPMIESTPRLAKLIGPARSKDGSNSASLKEFPGGHLVLTGANSGASLRSTPARYLFLDEVDAFPANVDREGDPVDLAIRRTTTFRSRRKILMVSTPSVRGYSRIETAYLASDQRKLFVQCPECGDWAPITWQRIRWPEGRRKDAYLTCDECGGIVEEHGRAALLAGAEWRATAESDGRTAGFHLNALYSAFESWANIAEKQAAAKGDPAQLQVWVNTCLAETWEDVVGDSLDAKKLADRRPTITEKVPAGGLVLTAGIDTQDNRLEAQVVAWGLGEEAWIIAHEIFWGDPSGPDVWGRLDEWLGDTWACEAGPRIEVRAAAVDTGGHYTTAAYDFASARHHRRVWAIKGSNQPAAPAWPRRPSTNNARKVPLYMVGTNAIKDVLAARLGKTEPGPGSIHVTGPVPEAFFEQLTSERRITKMIGGRPVRVWDKKPGVTRNEAWDCLVYAYAAFSGLKYLGLDLEEEAQSFGELAAGVTSPQPKRVRSRWMNR